MKIFILALALALLSPSTTTLASSAGSCLPTCKEGSLKRGGGNPGGAVFVCRKGRWEVLIDCCAGESCVSDPIATCTWAKAFAEDAVGAIASFEISPELVAADIEKKAAAASTAPADNKVCISSHRPRASDWPFTGHQCRRGRDRRPLRWIC